MYPNREFYWYLNRIGNTIHHEVNKVKPVYFLCVSFVASLVYLCGKKIKYNSPRSTQRVITKLHEVNLYFPLCILYGILGAPLW
jgi:hypothetical protein